MTFLDRWAPQLHAALRIVAALLFMEHGLMKLFHFPAAQPGAPTPLPMMLVVAAVIEVGGGALIALGLFTRLAAFICAGEMAVAYFMAHAPRGFWPALNMGEGAILFTFIFLFLAAAGPGAWSVDGTMGKKR
jgi:putative oxidoreductase